MPAVTLVVCLYRQRDLLERLLREADGCHDELVVVHDGPDADGVKAVVEAAGGRFFEHPRVGSLEAQSPFAWAQASHDWILRLDADEFPGAELKAWLQQFRHAPEPVPEIAGYTCIWPLWNGSRAVSQRWPEGRLFLLHRQRVRFFGLIEQPPVPDGRCEPLELVLHHQPGRKSYGFHNVLVRPQAYRWRAIIAASLFGQPADLPGWRWENRPWPLGWEQIRQRPLWTACKRLLKEPVSNLRRQWKAEKKLFPAAAFSDPIHHALICLKYWQLRRKTRLQR